MSLEEYRRKIDEIDEVILEKLQERMKVAEEIASLKKDAGLPVFDYSRERQLLEGIVDKSSPEFATYNKMLFSSILEASKDHQRKLIQEKSAVVAEIEKALKETPQLFPASATVACQGVQGAYSQEAADKFFKQPKIMYMKSFEGVFAAIRDGLCKYGILPLENSSAGSVNQVYDLMMEYNFHIVRSTRLKVNHCLLVNPGTDKSQITEVISHPQALAQCEKYLKGFKDVKITEWDNTAEAARRVAESGRTDLAAIGSETNGKIYGLEALESGVQDTQNNYTRFICISKNLEIYPGANRTSLMMILPHKPGALYNVLAGFNALGINLEKLESRPLPEKDFEFMFYFDIQESVYSHEFIRMMNQLSEISLDFRYLGSYSEY